MQYVMKVESTMFALDLYLLKLNLPTYLPRYVGMYLVAYVPEIT